MANILLINPEPELVYPDYNRSHFPPLPLAYTSSVLRSMGHEVQWMDLRSTDGNAANRIIEGKFDIALLSNHRSYTLFAFLSFGIMEAARWLKDVSPDTLVAVADPQLLKSEKMLLDDPSIDLVVFGRVERSFPAMVDALEEAAWDASRVASRPLIVKEQTTPLPYPDATVLIRHENTGSPGRSMGSVTLQMNASSGCPYDCSYCQAIQIFGRDVNMRTVNDIRSEIIYWQTVDSVDHVIFWDEIFTVNRKRTLELCTALRDLKITWSCATRVDRIDDVLLDEMARAGCRSILFGIERLTGENAHKVARTKRERAQGFYRKLIDMCEGVGILPVFSLMIGFKEDTPEVLAEEQSALAELAPPFAYVRTVIPLAGTPFYDTLVGCGDIAPIPNWRDQELGGEPWGYPTVCTQMSRLELRRAAHEITRELEAAQGRGGHG